MPNVYSLTAQKQVREDSLNNGEINSLIYHDLFDYPLSFAELVKWKAAPSVKVVQKDAQILYKNGLFFFEGREGIVYKRALRARDSKRKLIVAKSAARFIGFLPAIRMIAVTGSLAMSNTAPESDIDLMLVVKKGKLWTTRALTYLILKMTGFPVRKPGDKQQEDKLCLNIWMDESDMVWKSGRNVYSAHEIGQILPLVNRENTYEKLLSANKWILKYWPNSVKIFRYKKNGEVGGSGILEKVLYWLQVLHMKRKITREVVTPTRALFHPQDWGEIVLTRLRPLV